SLSSVRCICLSIRPGSGLRLLGLFFKKLFPSLSDSGRHWQAHKEGRALSWLALNPNTAAVLTYQLHTGRKPKTSAALAALGGVKRDPDFFERIRWNTRTIITHTRDQRTRFRVTTD